MSKILKGLTEVNPHNYDSDWDYQDAVAKSGRSRSGYRSQEDDTFDADVAYSRKMYQLGQQQKAAKEKAQRDSDHDRLATGTNESARDYTGIYSPEALKLGTRFCEHYNITDDNDIQLAIELIDGYLDIYKMQNIPVDLKDLKSKLASDFRQVYRGMGPGPSFRKKFQEQEISEVDNPWGDQGNFVGDTPQPNIGGTTVKRLQVGDTVKYLGQLARIDAMSKTGNTSRITIGNKMGGVTQDVLTTDLKRINSGMAEEQLDEISNQKLGQYKTAAALDAGKADKEGDYKRADKRFSGIVKATKKQFANDTKKSGISQGINEFAPIKPPTAGAFGGNKDYGQPNSSRYIGGNKFVVGTTNNYVLTATIDKWGLEWDEDDEIWFLDSPGAAHIADASEGEIELPPPREQRNQIHDLVTDYLNERNSADLQKVAAYYGHSDDGEMATNEGMADEKPTEPFKTGYPRVNNPKILGTQNRAKSIYHPPTRPPIKKLDKPLPENLGNELKSKSLEALQQVKQKLEQQRMADLEQWEKDFKQNTVAKFTAREPNLNQRATSTPMVAMPGEKHSDLKARLSQLDKAIEKQGILDNLVQKLDKKGLLTPNIEAGVDTSMLVRDGARDNYVELNRKLDKALEYVKNRLLTNKAAYAKPKAIDEDDGVPTRMRMNDYMDLADAIQEKLRHAIQMGDKARIQELNKQRDELDAHVKKYGMMPEDIAEEQLDELSCWSGYHRVAGTKAGFPGSCAKNKTNEQELDEIDRRGFLKGVGAAAVAGAAGTGIGYEIGKKEKTSKLQMPSNPQAYFLLGYVYNMISGLILNSNTEMSKWSNEMFDLHSQAKVEVASSDNNNLEMSYHKGTKAARDTINEIKGWNNYPIDPTGKAAGLTQDQAWEYDRKFRNDTEIARQIENKTRPYYDKLMKMVRQNNSVQQGVAEGASGIEQKIIKLYKQGLSDDEIASSLKIDSDDVKRVLDDYEWVADTTGEGKGVAEEKHSCPHCGGEMVSEELMNEKKDACYYKVKSRYKVWPSAYASGALVKCRNKGASNWGNGGKKNEGSILEGINRADESLHDWFNKEKWVRMDTKGKIKGPCAREPGEGKPKCLPQSKAHSLGKKGRASAAQRKRREDPNPERSGKAINVDTKKSKG